MNNGFDEFIIDYCYKKRDVLECLCDDEELFNGELRD